jgi:hypothetical protein
LACKIWCAGWVRRALQLDTDVDIDLLLAVARDAAHSIARPAAPVTTFLIGVAAGRAGGSPDDVRVAAATVADLIAAQPPPASN